MIDENLRWPVRSLNVQLWITSFLWGGAGLYTLLFWKAQMGLNTLLFSGFILLIVWLMHPEFRSAPRIWASMLGVVLSAIAVVWQHSVLAQLTHIVSIFLLLGFAQAQELRFLGFALLLAMGSLLSMPLTWWRRWEKAYEATIRGLSTWAYLALLPVALLSLFFGIYYNANAEFAKLIDNVLAWLPRLSPWKSMALFLQGTLLISALILPSVWTSEFRSEEQRYSLQKIRKRLRLKVFSPTLALRRHYYSALLSFSLLNVLLLVVNLTDVKGVWLNRYQHSATELSDFVHQGTYLLIAALTLAMGVIAFFFRGNLHFLQNNKPLKSLAYTWIIQNTILALSVAWRNYHYIAEYGLAYKRLGVLWFLILVIGGLYTLYMMIQERRSLYYLWVINAWFLYTSLVMTSFVNWDVLITRYNLHYAKHATIDTPFLLKEVSDKNLPILLNEHSLLLKRSSIDPALLDRKLQAKIQRFEQRNAKLDWRGWNWADAKTAQGL